MMTPTSPTTAPATVPAAFPPIPFLDLRLDAGPDEPDTRDGHDEAGAVRAAIARVVARGWFVLGPEVEAFEAEFASASGARFAVGVGTGTDAIALLLRAAGVGAGDEVIVPALTAAFTGLAVIMAGATPVFADVDEGTLTLDPAACDAAVTPRTRAVVPVHLYGQPASDEVLAVASRHALAVGEDCCQAHLATSNGVPVGTRGVGGAFSFYPTKNLGALGDGGAIITNDPAVADRVRRLRNGGQTDRYHHAEAGINSRLDEMQAAILRARLPRLADMTARRRRLASAYRRQLPPVARPVATREEAGHVYHIFAVQTDERDALQAHLRAAGVETLIHYPVPLPEQPAFAEARARAAAVAGTGAARGGDCPVAARAARRLLSLPLHPRLADADLTRVAGAIGAFRQGRPPA